MDEERSGRIRLPLSGAALLLFALAFLLPGVLGRAPWRLDDALGIGVAFDMYSGGGWLVPQLAGEPFLADGPLYYWVAAAFGKLLGWAMRFAAAARLAAALFVLAALWFVRLAARELYGDEAGNLSVLALIGSLGLFLHAHEATPETAMLAGSAAAYYGLAIAWKKPWKAAAVFAVGAGVAFLARGLPALIPPLAAAVLLLPLAIANRARSYALAAAAGVALLLPIVAAWPALLAWQAPGVLEAWIAGQAATVSQPITGAGTLDAVKTLAWAAWPAWPLALWATWAFRRHLRDPGFAVPAVATLVSFLLLLTGPTQRDIDTLAVLVPLAIPAGTAALGLRRGAANSLAYFSVATFGLAAVTLWFLWLAMMSGVPPTIARNVLKLAPGFTPGFEWWHVLVAIGYTAAWLLLATRTERVPARSLTAWAAGVTLAWGLAATLFLSWADHIQSYAPLAAALKKALPASSGCVASQNLSEVHRAVLHYHAGLVTQRREVGAGGQCSVLLVRTREGARSMAPGPEWKRIADIARPRDRDRFLVYRRDGRPN
jgi:4-amino-4-deoxy-L-arabinose transferase-like glycosyltransferase